MLQFIPRGSAERGIASFRSRGAGGVELRRRTKTGWGLEWAGMERMRKEGYEEGGDEEGKDLRREEII